MVRRGVGTPWALAGQVHHNMNHALQLKARFDLLRMWVRQDRQAGLPLYWDAAWEPFESAQMQCSSRICEVYDVMACFSFGK